MNDIIINILRDGTISGTMRFNFANAFHAWGVNMFKRFLKLVKVSDSETGTNALEMVVETLFKWAFDWFKTELPEFYRECPDGYEATKKLDFKAMKKYYKPAKFVDDIEKSLKFLQIASPEKFAEFTEWKKNYQNEIEHPHTLKEEESTMKNNVVWYLRGEEAAADCIKWNEYEAPAEIEEEEEATAEHTKTEPQEEPAPTVDPAEPKHYKAEELHRIMNTSADHVKYTGRTAPKYEGGYYITYGARFIEGALYRIPDACKKSRAADIVFKVDRNTGKTLTITVWEKYNGTITENTCKNKKLNPGSKYFWLHVDPETGKTIDIYKVPDAERYNYIDFGYWECIDIDKVSRWTSGTLSVVRAEPITAAELEAFQNVQPVITETKTATETAPKSYDFTPKYYPVSEKLAQMHKEMISFDDYKEGSQTAEYKQYVNKAYKLAENSSDPEKSLYLADCFAKRLARWFDDMNRNGASCPSILICGGSNFPTRKKERQNARYDTLMHQYHKIMGMLDKIKKPHGYEIVRDNITDEFENVLYFDTVINTEENRLQLIFDGKPGENVRSILKANGFRWSGRFKAWQRQLTENAVCAVWRVVDKLDELENAEAEEMAAETKKAA